MEKIGMKQNNKSKIKTNIEIIEANKNDIDDILYLKQKIYNKMDNKEWYEIAGTDKNFLEKLLLNEGLILKAVVDNQLVGYLIMERYLNPNDQIIKLTNLDTEVDNCLELSNIGVDDNYRGNHLQQKMINIAEKIMLSKYNIKYILATVHPNNIASLKNLTNISYKIVSKAKMYGGKDRNILLKTIK